MNILMISDIDAELDALKEKIYASKLVGSMLFVNSFDEFVTEMENDIDLIFINIDAPDDFGVNVYAEIVVEYCNFADRIVLIVRDPNIFSHVHFSDRIIAPDEDIESLSDILYTFYREVPDHDS